MGFDLFLLLCLKLLCEKRLRRYKENIGQQIQGNRLAFCYETWTIGYGHPQGKKMREHYNFGPSESRQNCLNINAVTRKEAYLDDSIVNPYQKPLKLMDWFIRHFSHPGDWILDLCAGTGSTTVAGLSLGRNCMAVEKSKKQAERIETRIMMAPKTLDYFTESSEVGLGDLGTEVAPSTDPADELVLRLPSVVTPVKNILKEKERILQTEAEKKDEEDMENLIAEFDALKAERSSFLEEKQQFDSQWKELQLAGQRYRLEREKLEEEKARFQEEKAVLEEEKVKFENEKAAKDVDSALNSANPEEFKVLDSLV